MNDDLLRDPSVPLLAFFEALGITVDDWSRLEEAAQLRYETNLTASQASHLTPAHITALRDAYGDAVWFRFSREDWNMLSTAHAPTEEKLQEFRRDLGTDNVNFSLRLDKQNLLNTWLGAIPSYCHVLLILFRSALDNLVERRFDKLEGLLWPTVETTKAILLVPASQAWYEGEYLSVVGLSNIPEWKQAFPPAQPDTGHVQRIYKDCRANLNWQTQWVARLTPLHVTVQTKSGDARLSTALQIHLANLTALYTADRTAESNGRLISTYAGVEKISEIPLAHVPELVDKAPTVDVDGLTSIISWAYDSDVSPDGRLPLIQAVMTQSLYTTPEPDRYEVFLRSASSIAASLEWQWKAILEKKLEAYLGQVKALEEVVANTVASVSQQISDMAKGLSEAVLAAVATIVVAGTGSLLSDKFNPTIFAVGLLVYGAYVLLFPNRFNMEIKRESYNALLTDYDSRRAAFVETLGPPKVEKIESGRVEARKSRFEHWFGLSKQVYKFVGGGSVVLGALFLLVALGQAFAVPGRVTPGASTPTPSIPVAATQTPRTQPTTTPSATMTPMPTLAPTPTSYFMLPLPLALVPCEYPPHMATNSALHQSVHRLLRKFASVLDSQAPETAVRLEATGRTYA